MKKRNNLQFCSSTLGLICHSEWTFQVHSQARILPYATVGPWCINSPSANGYSALSHLVIWIDFCVLSGKSIEFCEFYEHNSADRSLWQNLSSACHALMCCCHGSMTQQGLVRWLLCPVGAGDVKQPPTMKMDHWAMWIIQLRADQVEGKLAIILACFSDLGRLCLASFT